MFHFRVRNGTGWGHQAMTTRLRFLAFVLLQPLARVVISLLALGSVFCCSCLLFSLLDSLLGVAFSRLTSAWLVVLFLSYAFALTQGSSSVLSKACHRRSDRGLLDVSSARLNTLLQLHLRPIYVVVFHAPIGRTHLGRDLALRCFQRLFLPHLATRPCS